MKMSKDKTVRSREEQVADLVETIRDGMCRKDLCLNSRSRGDNGE